MTGPLVAIGKDPSLRLVCAVLMLFGAVIASIAPYHSLIGCKSSGFPIKPILQYSPQPQSSV